MKPCGIHHRVISREVLQIFTIDVSLKIFYLRLQLHLPVTQELSHVVIDWTVLYNEINAASSHIGPLVHD